MPHHNPNVNIHGTEELMHLSVSVSQIIVDCDCCNDMQLTSLDFSRFSNLTVIRIGSHSFRYVNEVRIVSLGQLEKVVIENGCFTKCDDSFNPNRHFYLKNCERLRKLKIGCNSFSDYSVCEIDTLPSLEEIKIGILGASTASFSYSSLELNSFIGALFIMDRPPEAEITPLWSLRFRWLFSGSV